MLLKYALMILGVGACLSWHWVAYLNLQKSMEAQEEYLPDDSRALPWSLLDKTSVTNGVPSYDLGLREREGSEVVLEGVIFALKPLIVDGKANGAILMPPSKIACCGVSCDPDPGRMIFLDCEKHPFAEPPGKCMATVTGRLKLHDDNTSWALYTLEEAHVAFKSPEK